MLVTAIETLRAGTGSGRSSVPAFRTFQVSTPNTPVPAPRGRNFVEPFVVVAHDDVDTEEAVVLERLESSHRSVPGLEITSITRRELARLRSHPEARDVDNGPQVMTTLTSPDPSVASLEIVAVKTREQMQAYLATGDPEAGTDEDEPRPTVQPPVPVRVNATVRQWNGQVGSGAAGWRRSCSLIRRQTWASCALRLGAG